MKVHIHKTSDWSEYWDMDFNNTTEMIEYGLKEHGSEDPEIIISRPFSDKDKQKYTYDLEIYDDYRE